MEESDDFSAAVSPPPSSSRRRSDSIKSDMRAAMVAQLRYAKHGIASSTASTQCDLLTMGSVVLGAFCRLVAPLQIDRSRDLMDCAASVDRLDELVRAKTTTREALIIDFCASLVGFLELNLGHSSPNAPRDLDDSGNELADGLRASERHARHRAMISSPQKQQIEAQAAKIMALEEDLKRTKARHLQQIAQLEVVGRENIRFAVHTALEQAKGAAAAHGSKDADGLRFENVSMANKLRLREIDVARLEEEVKALQSTVEYRELEIANLEIALVKVSADKEHHKEDVVRRHVIDHSRIDGSIASLNGKVANFAETIMTYAAAIRDMEVKHSTTLRRQTAAHDAHCAALERELASLRAAVAERDAKLLDVMKENAALSSRVANRAVTAARSNAIASQRTPAFVSRGPIPDSPAVPLSSQQTPYALTGASGGHPPTGMTPIRRRTSNDELTAAAASGGENDNPKMPASQMTATPRRPSSTMGSPSGGGGLRRKVSFTAFAPSTPTGGGSRRPTPDSL